MQPEVVCAAGATLGEGPAWIAGALWFTDIKAARLHRFEPATRALTWWPAPDAPGWVLPLADGDLMVGARAGLHRFDPATGAFTLWLPVVGPPGIRLNDAAADARGRLWFGTMDDAEGALTGRFHRLARGRVEPTIIPPCAITNGPALSPDARTLYSVDTVAGAITAWDVADDGALSAPRPFARVDPADGHPDGPTVDADGCVWVGLYGGWRARRYAPTGEQLADLRFPVANVTKIAFGGPDLRTAYATTARWLLDAAAAAAQPLAGHLFAFDAGVAGLPTPPIDPGA